MVFAAHNSKSISYLPHPFALSSNTNFLVTTGPKSIDALSDAKSGFNV